MAVSRGATVSQFLGTDNQSDHSFSHTADSSTSLMILVVGLEGAEDLSATPVWDSVGDNLTFTLINDSGNTGANQDTRLLVYGLVGAITTGASKTITVTTSTNANPSWCCAVNYIGTETASVAAATNHLSTDNNTVATDTSVHASAGNAGNCLFQAGICQGSTSTPASNNASFTEVVDSETGAGGGVDFGVYYSDDVNVSGATAITVTWAIVQENTSSFVEVVVASASGLPGRVGAARGIARGVARGIG